MGKEDPFIPVAQMSDMVDLIKKRGVRADLIVFEGEGHGWRRASTVETVLKKQIDFVADIFGVKNEP